MLCNDLDQTWTFSSLPPSSCTALGRVRSQNHNPIMITHTDSEQRRVVVALLALPAAAAFLCSPTGTGVSPLNSLGVIEHQRQLRCTSGRSPKTNDTPLTWKRTLSVTSALVSRDSVRLDLRRDELSEETVRELEAGDRRMKELEEEYWKSLNPEELAIERKCASGLAYLKMGLLDRAAEDYLQSSRLSPPGARTWPLGMVLYYLDRSGEAKSTLEVDIGSFESKFEESATDERIWRAAALIRESRLSGDAPEDTAAIVARLPDLEFKEPGPLRKMSHDLFRGQASPGDVVAVLLEDGEVDYSGMDFFAKFFLGLWHDAHGNEDDILLPCDEQQPESCCSVKNVWHLYMEFAFGRKWSQAPENKAVS